MLIPKIFISHSSKDLKIEKFHGVPDMRWEKKRDGFIEMMKRIS